MRCAFCHGPLDPDAGWTCPGCSTRLHHDCRDAAATCPTLGCGLPAAGAAKPTRGSRWWPLCGVLLAAAVLGPCIWIRARTAFNGVLRVDVSCGPPRAIGFAGDTVVVRYLSCIAAWTLADGLRCAWPALPGESPLAVSPRGDLAIAGHEVVALPGGAAVGRFPIVAAGWSPDGAEVIGTEAFGARWCLARADGTETRPLESSPAPSRLPAWTGPVAFSLDGRRVAGLDLDGVRIWDRATGVRLATLTWIDEVKAIGLSPDGERVVIVGARGPHSGGQILAEGPVIDGAPAWSSIALAQTESRGDRSYLVTSAVAPDASTVATGSSSGDVTVFDAHGRTLAAFHDHSYGVTALAFSPDGRFLASGADDNLLVVHRAPR